MPLRFQHLYLLIPGYMHKVRSYRAMRPPYPPYKRGTGPLLSVLDMPCDCSEQQAQRIECDYCNPQSCVCVEGEPDICIFCEREFIYLQSDNDGSSVISHEDCSSISSRAGANSCIQSPEQHDYLSKTFGDTVSIMHPRANELLCLEVADDSGAGPSGLSGNVGRSCTNTDGLLEGGRTSTPNTIQHQFPSIQDSRHRRHESCGSNSDEDSNTKQRSKRGRSLSKQREYSPVLGRGNSRSVSPSSTISSSSTGSSSSQSRSSSVEREQYLVHDNAGQQTSKPSKSTEDKGRTESKCSPSPTKKIKSVRSDSKDQESKRKSVFYWSY